MTALRHGIVGFIAGMLAAGGALAAQPAQWGMLDEYCVSCHNVEDWAGGVAFDALSPARVGSDAQVWEAVLRKLRGHLMPPPGSPQPPVAQRQALARWVTTSLDGNTGRPVAGHLPAQRLSRTQYANAVRDLLGIDVDVRQLLPPEIEVNNFDNIAAALSVSPAFLDQYLGAARVIAKRAVGDPVARPAFSRYASPVGPQDEFADGFPLGTRGGMKFTHDFLADGEYRFSVLDLDFGLYPRAAETRHTLVMLVDGKEVFRQDVGGPEELAIVNREGAAGAARLMKRLANVPAQVRAGAHEVVVTFIERSKAESDEWVAPWSGSASAGSGVRVPRLLDGVTVAGPFAGSGVSESRSRKAIFVCRPERASEEALCARRIIEQLARRAYRRPPSEEDVRSLLPFYEAGSKQPGGFDTGIQQVVAAVLSSPDFLYRAILPPADGTRTAHRLGDLEVASRLAFFLWGQGPDDELIGLAASNALSKPATLRAQVRRMLADARAQSLVDGFALRWLHVDELESVDPDPLLFPGFSKSLRNDFAREIQLFLADVLLQDRSLVTLLDGDYSFLNERLARHYGVPGVRGVQFRRVPIEDSRRHGLLGKGAVLLSTSYGDRTSPVLRGAWVLDKLLGTPPTAPPANVVTDLSTPSGERPKTIRARLEQHRVDESCNQCHGVIDPLGLALENFDAVGRWRETDAVSRDPIDAGTVLAGGARVSGPLELRRELLRRPDEFIGALTEKLMMYGLGRELEWFDMPQVRRIVANAKREDYRLSAIVLGIVESDAFRMQSVAPKSAAPATVAGR